MRIIRLRKKTSLRYLTSALTIVCVLVSDLCAVPLAGAQTAAEIPGQRTEAAAFSFPSGAGVIEETYTGKAKETVILIQDAHAIPEAQKSIRLILEWLAEKHGVKVTGVEGAASALDATLFRHFPDRDILEKIFNDYMEDQELTGPAAACLFGPASMKYYGLEDWNLYEEGTRHYLKAREQESAAADYLQTAESRLQTQKKRSYSQTLLDIDSALAGFYAGTGELGPALQQLAVVSAPKPNTALAFFLEQLQKQENDNAQLSSAVQRAAMSMAELISVNTVPDIRSRLPELNRKRQEFSTSQITARAMALYLHEFMQQIRGNNPEALPEETFPAELLSQVRTEQKLRDLDGSVFFDEFETYAAAIKKQLFQGEEDRALDQKSRRFYLLRRLSSLELTWKEFSEFETTPLSADEENLFQANVDFYRTAKIRDGIFFKNLVRLAAGTGSAAAVVGGYHIRGLREELKREGISYIIVRPAIKKLPASSRYGEQMRGEVSWRDYFENKDGKVDLQKAFTRAARDRLIKASETDGQALGAEPLIKRWRDALIRGLAADNRLDEAVSYTGYLDELTASEDAPQDGYREAWKENLLRLVDRLQDLQYQGELNPQNVAQLLKGMKSVAPAPANAFSPARLSADLVAVQRSELRQENNDSKVTQVFIDLWNDLQLDHGHELFRAEGKTKAVPNHDHQLTRLLSDNYAVANDEGSRAYYDFFMYAMLHPDFKVRRQAANRFLFKQPYSLQASFEYLLFHFMQPWDSLDRYGPHASPPGIEFKRSTAVRSKRLTLLAMFSVLGDANKAKKFEIDDTYVEAFQEELRAYLEKDAERMGESGVKLLRRKIEENEDVMSGEKPIGLLEGMLLELMRHDKEARIEGKTDAYAFLSKDLLKMLERLGAEKASELVRQALSENVTDGNLSVKSDTRKEKEYIARAKAFIDEWNVIQPDHGENLFVAVEPTIAAPEYKHRLVNLLADDYPMSRHQDESEFYEFLMYALLHPDFKVRRQVVNHLAGVGQYGLQANIQYLLNHFRKPWISVDTYGPPLMPNGKQFKLDIVIRAKRQALLSVFAILGGQAESKRRKIDPEYAEYFRSALNEIMLPEAEAIYTEGVTALDWFRREARERGDLVLAQKREIGILEGSLLERLRYERKTNIEGNADALFWLNRDLEAMLGTVTSEEAAPTPGERTESPEPSGIRHLQEQLTAYLRWTPWEPAIKYPVTELRAELPGEAPEAFQRAISDPRFFSPTIYNLLPDLQGSAIVNIELAPHSVAPGSLLVTLWNAEGKSGKVVFHTGTPETLEKFRAADKDIAFENLSPVFPRLGAAVKLDDETSAWTAKHADNEYRFDYEYVADSVFEFARREYAFENDIIEADMALIRDLSWDPIPFVPNVRLVSRKPWNRSAKTELTRRILQEAASRNSRTVLTVIKIAKNYVGKWLLTAAFLRWRISVMFDKRRRNNAPGLFTALRTIWSKKTYRVPEPPRAHPGESRSELRTDEKHPDAQHMIDDWNLIQAEHGNDLFTAITAVLAKPSYRHRLTRMLADETGLAEHRGKKEYFDFLMYVMLHPDFKVRRQAVNHLLVSGDANLHVPAEYLVEHFRKPWLSIDLYGEPVLPGGATFNRSLAIRSKRLALLSAFATLGNLEKTEIWNTDKDYAKDFRAKLVPLLEDELRGLYAGGVTEFERIRDLVRKRGDAVLSEEREISVVEGIYLEVLRFKAKKEAKLKDPLDWLNKDLIRMLLFSGAEGVGTTSVYLTSNPARLPWKPGLLYPIVDLTPEALSGAGGAVRQALEDPSFLAGTVHNLFRDLAGKPIRSVKASPAKEEIPGQLRSYEVEIENEDGKKGAFILYEGHRDFADRYIAADDTAAQTKLPFLFPRLGSYKAGEGESRLWSIQKIQSAFKMNRLFLAEAALYLARRGFVLDGPFTESDIAFIEGPQGVPHTVFLKPNYLRSKDTEGSRARHMMLELFKTFGTNPAAEKLDLIRLATKHISRIDIGIAYLRWRSIASRLPELERFQPRFREVLRILLLTRETDDAPKPERIEGEARSELREAAEGEEKARQLSQVANYPEWHKALPDRRLNTAHGTASFLWKFWPQVSEFVKSRGFEEITHWFDAMRSDKEMRGGEADAFELFIKSEPEITEWINEVTDPQRLSLFFRSPRHYAWLYGEILRRLKEAQKSDAAQRELKIDLIGPGFYQEPLSILSLIKTAYEEESVTLEDVKLEINVFDKNDAIHRLLQEGNLVFTREEISYWPKFFGTAVSLHASEEYAEEASFIIEKVPAQFMSLFVPLTDEKAGNVFVSPDQASPWLKTLVFRGDYYEAEESASADYAILNYVGIYLDGVSETVFMKKVLGRLAEEGFVVAISGENIFDNRGAFTSVPTPPAIYQKKQQADPEERSELRTPEKDAVPAVSLPEPPGSGATISNLVLAVKPGIPTEPNVEALSDFVVYYIEQNSFSVFVDALERSFTELAWLGGAAGKEDVLRNTFLMLQQEIMQALRNAAPAADRKVAIAVDVPAGLGAATAQLAKIIPGFNGYVARAGFTGEGRKNQELMEAVTAAGIEVNTQKSPAGILEKSGFQKLVPLLYDSGTLMRPEETVLAFGIERSGLENDSEAVKYYAELYASLTSTGLAVASALTGETREQIVERFKTRNFEGLTPEVARLLEALLLKQYGDETGPVLIISGDNRVLTSAAAMKVYLEFRAEEQLARSA